MKLILAIVQDYDTDRVLRGVTSAGFRVTRISSTGGFLRSTNATLIMGVEDEEVGNCLAIVNNRCGIRIHDLDTVTEESWLEMAGGEISRDAYGGAVVLVVQVERFERLLPAEAAHPMETPTPAGLAGRARLVEPTTSGQQSVDG